MPFKKLLHTSLQAKVLFFIILILFLSLSVSSIIYIRDFQKDYIEVIEWRSISLAQSIAVDINSRQQYLSPEETFLNLETAYLLCKKIYEANKDHHVLFISVLNSKGRIAAHSDKSQHGKTLENPLLLDALASRQTRTIRLSDSYHTLIPLFFEENQIGAIDIGFPRQIVEERIATAVQKTLVLCVLFFILVFALVYLAFKKLVQKPIFALVEATNDIADGDLCRAIPRFPTKEFSHLSNSLIHMRDSIQANLSAIQHKNEEFRALIACSPVALFSIDRQHRITIWTDSAKRLFGWDTGEVLGDPLPQAQNMDFTKFQTFCQECTYGEPLLGRHLQLSMKDGTVFHASVSCAPIKDQQGILSGLMLSVENINERIAREQANKELQDQLTQAQKMESIGRLAGGVAHDYNNMLGVIIGNADLALLKTSESHSSHNHLNEILKAARHSADITKQLLAFARKQTIIPQAIDLNDSVDQMLQMLRRLLAENIQLEWLPCEDSCVVNMDVTQIDQVLANLCINAGDALPDGGTITIQTSRQEIDERYNLSHAEAMTGQYICLSISDNGIGMDRNVREKIFEPFFTTKGQGEGTGLGLATVYGIIKQNNGFVNVYSEPGKGTTFNIYFPEQDTTAISKKPLKPVDSYTGNGETIMVIEDESAILAICKQMLELLNYQVVATTDAEKALALAQENQSEIKLLISDVVLEKLSGPELCSRIRNIIPGLKTLYMSGYTADVIARQGILPENIHFIQKPFTQQKLAEMVWKALHED